MIRCMSLERTIRKHGGDEITNMCSRRFFFVFENYYSLVDTCWKTEVVGKLYYVRSGDENVGGSVVEIFLESGSHWQAVLLTVHQRTEGGTVGVV